MTYWLLAGLLSVAVCLYWQPIAKPVIGVLLLGVLCAIIGILERALHTEYIIRDGILTIRKGRFVKNTELPLDKIVKATKLDTSVLIITSHAEYKIRPQNPDAFIKCIEKYQP